MKKIENWLLLPLLFIVFGNYLFVGKSMLHIDHDVQSAQIITDALFFRFFLFILVVLFLLYKIIRKRYGAVNKPWAFSHIAITMLFTVIIWYLVQNQQWPRFYLSTSFNDVLHIWARYNKALVIAACIFLLIQISFLIYFTVKLVKKPL
jgi:hypothetical protein